MSSRCAARPRASASARNARPGAGKGPLPGGAGGCGSRARFLAAAPAGPDRTGRPAPPPPREGAGLDAVRGRCGTPGPGLSAVARAGRCAVPAGPGPSEGRRRAGRAAPSTAAARAWGAAPDCIPGRLRTAQGGGRGGRVPAAATPAPRACSPQRPLLLPARGEPRLHRPRPGQSPAPASSARARGVPGPRGPLSAPLSRGAGRAWAPRARPQTPAAGAPTPDAQRRPWSARGPVSMALSCAAALLLWVGLGLGQQFPFQDPSLPWDQRLDDLVGRLSLEEMVLQMARGGAKGNGPAPGIERLGIQPYNWNTECLRGDGEAPGWATAFPQALGLAASFSPELIYRVANATATEVRAKHNHFMAIGKYSDHTGLSCFSPVLNIMRHPLWGRNQETYGEDPFLSAELGASFVKGLQGPHPRYVKASAGCKHFSVHGGPENLPVSRYCFDAKVGELDWRTTFLPQFEACVHAGSYSFMCSYNRINGVPACAHEQLLTGILREEWGFQGYVVSDEGAVELILLGHHYTHSFLETAIAAVNAGLNLELTYGLRKNIFTLITEAVAQGNITMETVKARVRPLFYTRLRLGEFDPPEMNPYRALGMDTVQSPAHQALALEAAIKTLVLLKNVEDMLPLRAQDLAGGRIAVVGPFADSPHVLFGDYAPVPDPQYIVTPRRGLEALPANVSFAAGCHEPQCLHYVPAEVKAAVRGANVVIVCLGTGTDLESEMKDRRDLALPGHQLQLLQDAVAEAAGRPVILLLFNAGPLDVSWAQAHPSVHAILACFFPAQAAGTAVTKVLLGQDGANPAGRLPATWPAGMHQVPAMENYTMVGRTYRYYGPEPPLYPFGYGLSYTSFHYQDLVLDPPTLPVCANLSVSVVLENRGPRDGEEVVQLYLRWGRPSVPAPRWQLVAFRRVALGAGRAARLRFQLPRARRAVWAGRWLLEPGPFTLFVGGQQPQQARRAGSAVLRGDFTVAGAARALAQC